jgi:hypothetical protein
MEKMMFPELENSGFDNPRFDNLSSSLPAKAFLNAVRASSLHRRAVRGWEIIMPSQA